MATWNLLADGRPAAPLCAALRALGADVIAIQELQTHVAAAIDGDPVLAFRYPHRWLAARGDIQGMGLLSRWPLLRRERQLHPPTLRATVDLGGPGLVTIVTTHPVPPRIRALGLLPVGYEPAARDHALRRATALLDEAIERGERMILAGDLNLTDREPAYRRLPAALVDAQRAAGTWPGSTWRPRSMLALPFGLLRIDHVFAGPGATPLRTRVVRSAAGSDHFPVVATFRLDGRGAAAARRQRR